MSDLVRLKVKRSDKYTVLNLTAIEDAKLSWKGKGLFVYLISRPSGWQIRKSDLLRRATDGDTSLQSAVAELKAIGYLRITEQRDAKGQFKSTTWEVSEEPEKLGNTTSPPQMENPSTEKPPSGKSTHLVDNKFKNYQNSSSPTPPLGEEEKKVQTSFPSLPYPFNRLLPSEARKIKNKCVKVGVDYQLHGQVAAERYKDASVARPAGLLLALLYDPAWIEGLHQAVAREAAREARKREEEAKARAEEEAREGEEEGIRERRAYFGRLPLQDQEKIRAQARSAVKPVLRGSPRAEWSEIDAILRGQLSMRQAA